MASKRLTFGEDSEEEELAELSSPAHTRSARVYTGSRSDKPL
jgi:hypothetical protein